MSWRVCCVIQRMGPRGKRVSRGSDGLGCWRIGDSSAWDGGSCWGWCRRFSLGSGSGSDGRCVVHLLYCRAKASEIQKAPIPGPIRIQRSSKVHCAPMRDDWVDPPPPPRRLMTQVPAGVHFHPCLPSSSVLAPKVSPFHGKERRKQQLNSRLDNTAHPPSQSRDEAMQELKRGRSF